MFKAFINFIKRILLFIFDRKQKVSQTKVAEAETSNETTTNNPQQRPIQEKPIAEVKTSFETLITPQLEPVQEKQQEAFINLKSETEHKGEYKKSKEQEPKKEKKGRKKTKQPKKRIMELFSFSRVDDLPESLEKNIVYIVGEKDFEWLIAFDCPCGCKEQILLNTLKETRPCWRFICYKNGSVTIIPSIDRTVNCRSHFTITKGELKWYMYSDDN